MSAWPLLVSNARYFISEESKIIIIFLHFKWNAMKLLKFPLVWVELKMFAAVHDKMKVYVNDYDGSRAYHIKFKH